MMMMTTSVRASIRLSTAGAAVASLLLCAPAALAAGDAAEGEKKSVACAACHGADGNSPNPMFPRLAGQWPDYIVKALEDYASGVRTNPVMAPLSAPLSPEDRDDIAAWYSSQTPILHTPE